MRLSVRYPKEREREKKTKVIHFRKQRTAYGQAKIKEDHTI